MRSSIGARRIDDRLDRPKPKSSVAPRVVPPLTPPTSQTLKPKGLWSPARPEEPTLGKRTDLPVREGRRNPRRPAAIPEPPSFQDRHRGAQLRHVHRTEPAAAPPSELGAAAARSTGHRSHAPLYPGRSERRRPCGAAAALEVEAAYDGADGGEFFLILRGDAGHLDDAASGHALGAAALWVSSTFGGQRQDPPAVSTPSRDDHREAGVKCSSSARMEPAGPSSTNPRSIIWPVTATACWPITSSSRTSSSTTVIWRRSPS